MKKALKYSAVFFLVIFTLLILINKIPSSQNPQVTEILKDENPTIKRLEDSKNPLVIFLSQKSLDGKDPRNLPSYLNLLEKAEAKDFFLCSSIGSSTLSNRLRFQEQISENFKGRPAEENLRYLKGSIGLLKMQFEQPQTMISLLINLALLNTDLELLNQFTSEQSRTPKVQEQIQMLKQMAQSILDQRVSITKNSLICERNSTIHLAENLNLEDLMTSAEGSPKKDLYTGLFFILYNKNRTQNTFYENSEYFIKSANCLENYSCDKICENELCTQSNLTVSAAGNWFQNYAGLQLQRLLTPNIPAGFKKINARFLNVKNLLAADKK